MVFEGKKLPDSSKFFQPCAFLSDVKKVSGDRRSISGELWDNLGIEPRVKIQYCLSVSRAFVPPELQS